MTKFLKNDPNRKCKYCGEVKPLYEFYSYIRSRDGSVCHSSSCKPCARIMNRAYHKSEHGREASRKWRESENGRAAYKKYAQQYRDRYPQKYTVHKIVAKAKRSGVVIVQPCRICGNPRGEAHHVSYSEPLNIDWLCRSCHHNIHHHPLP